jgi:acetyl esterase/lipase
VEVVNAGGVSVRVHGRSTSGAKRPGLLWIHGGGLVIGNPAQDDQLGRAFAQTLGIVVAAPEYRLAPEHPYPAALDDCYKALRWLSTQPNVDPTRLAVGGASAGGGLAAALALRARADSSLSLTFQLLTYPMLDDRTAVRTDLDERYVRLWDTRANLFGWESYTGVPAGSPEVVALAAPGRCEDFGGLPPTWIGVGTLDLFHDECLAYAEGLRSAGVPCTTEVVEGAFHGFDALRWAPVVHRFRQSQMTALASGLDLGEEDD